LFSSARFRARPDEVVAALRENSIGVASIYLELRRSPAAGLISPSPTCSARSNALRPSLMCRSPSPSGDAQNPADQAEGMGLRPYVRSGKAWTFLHGVPIPHERRPFRNFVAEAGKFHAREKRGPNHIGNAVGRRHHHRAAI